jgi:hypothetical protein
MSLEKAIDTLVKYVEDHDETPDYGDRLEKQFNALDQAVYLEARKLGLRDSDMPRKDTTFNPEQVLYFGRTNVPGLWSSPADAPTTLTMMATPGWRADMLALRALANVDTHSLAKAETSDALRVPWEDEQVWDDLQRLPRSLIRFMYGRKQADVLDIKNRVWECDDVSSDSLNVAIHRANKFLEKVGFAKYLEKKGEIVRWI